MRLLAVELAYLCLLCTSCLAVFAQPAAGDNCEFTSSFVMKLKCLLSCVLDLNRPTCVSIHSHQMRFFSPWCFIALYNVASHATRI